MPSLTRTVVADSEEPVSVKDFRTHIRSFEEDEDVAIGLYISAARRGLEEEYATALVPQQCVQRMDGFPVNCFGEIELRIAHVTSITSIQYVDTNGATQTLSPSMYAADIFKTPSRLRPAYGTSWPSTRLDMNAVTITFMAGYATPTAVPDPVKAMILKVAAELNDKREMTVTGATIAKIPGCEALMMTENWGAYSGSR